MKVLSTICLSTGLTLVCAIAAAATLAPPAMVTQHVDSLKDVATFAALPNAIRAGDFTVDGTPASGWKMAEPGGAFSATDVPVPGAPGRRFIFAGCDAQLCVLHYERGGVAHFYELLAVQRGAHGWIAIWNARGPKPLANLAALRALIRGASAGGWTQQSIKGDF